jgi:molybdopterin-synthase adenylyltransferase
VKHSIVFPNTAFQSTAIRLLQSSDEACAVFFAKPVNLDDKGIRFLVSDQFLLEPADYLDRTPFSTALSASTVFRIAQQAKRTGSAVVYAHTHPGFTGYPSFSDVDNRGEQELHRFLSRYLRPPIGVSVVISGNLLAAGRLLGSSSQVDVFQVGAKRTVLSEIAGIPRDERADRQIRAFGALGQALIESLHIGIVGLGGTGSATAQQLAYLGGSRFTLIDDDDVDETNLNRLVGATSKDIGRAKVCVASELIKQIHPSAHIDSINKSVIWQDVANVLVGCDLIFCCTDSHGSRAVLNQLAYQYFIPTIDMGASIVTEKGSVTHVVGRVQMLSPGLGCLTCGGLLDPGEVRRDLMEEGERHADPYFIGVGEPQPAVISLNSTISSLAVTMFLGVVTSLPLLARFQLYDAVTGTVRTVNHEPRKDCIVCSESGALGRGNDWDLPTRKAQSCTQPTNAV